MRRLNAAELEDLRDIITFLQTGGGYALGTVDAYNVANRTSAFGELLTVQPSPKAAWRFDYGINTDLVTTTIANAGAVTATNSIASLATGTNAAGSAILNSVHRLRYMPGLGGVVRFTAIFSPGIANSQQIIGVGDANDGFFFGFNGTQFGIMRRRNAVDEWSYQANWNGDAARFAPTRGNIYQIRYQWLGFGRIRFYVTDPDNDLGFANVHTIHYPNQNTGVSILNPTLPLYARVVNTGNTSNIVLQTASSVGFVEGNFGPTSNPLDVYRSRDASATFADVNVNHLLTIRNKTTFNSLANRLLVFLRSLSLGRTGAVGAAATTIYRIYKNATFAGALTYADVNATNSPVEVSTTTTTITSTETVAIFTLSEGSLFIPFNGEVFLQPGETLTIGVVNSGVQSTDVSGTMNWAEEF